MSTPLRLGILGCANIARQFARDVLGSPAVALAAVASRDIAKAQAFAAEFGVARALGGYGALIANPDVDAIYIPLPNSMHAEWGIAAAKAGKHVLCEKPLAMNLADTKAMFAAARAAGTVLLEGYPWWFQPQTSDMLALIEGDALPIGRVRLVQASIGFTVGNPGANIRMKPELGGGALYDAGCYPLSLIRLVMGDAPTSVTAHSVYANGVDLATMATLTWADGRRAQLSCSMDSANHRRGLIAGSAGTIETEYLNHTSDGAGHPHGYLPGELKVRRGVPSSVPFEPVASHVGSGFRFAAEAFAAMVANRDMAAMDRYAAMSLDIAATLEAIAASAREGRSITLG
jgi:predicted dehydrogenase